MTLHGAPPTPCGNPVKGPSLVQGSFSRYLKSPSGLTAEWDGSIQSEGGSNEQQKPDWGVNHRRSG
jgi:hypothetical protein